MAQVFRNHNNQLALLMSCTDSKALAVIGDGTQRVVKVFNLADFLLEYRPLDYDAKAAALKWVSGSNYIPLSEAAKKELLMLLLIKENTVIGKFPATEAAAFEKAVADCTGNFESVSSIEELTEYAGKDLAAIYNNLVPMGTPHIKLPLSEAKAKVAKKVWELAQKLADTVTATPTATRKKRARKVKGEKVMSERKGSEDGYRGKVRVFLTEGKEFTMDEVATHLGCDLALAKSKVRLVSKNPGARHTAVVYEEVPAVAAAEGETPAPTKYIVIEASVLKAPEVAETPVDAGEGAPAE
jgi:hypothetical protein